MKTLFVVLLACAPRLLSAATVEAERGYEVSYEIDHHATAHSARLLLRCHFSNEYDVPTQLQFGQNGSSETIVLNKLEYRRSTTPGNYVFQFYYNRYYREIETDSVEVKPGMITVITLHFQQAYQNAAVKKPVIYLYPAKKTPVTVTVQPAGHFTFTYPAYENAWKVVAYPDGHLTAGKQHYPYLFWEAEQPALSMFEHKDEGFLVKKAEVVPFFETTLSAMGFTAAERTDFITFWGPQLAAYDQCALEFVLQENCDQFATLSIMPKPDHVNRVYLLWSPVGATVPAPRLQPQVLPVLNRDGFDVLEWGGMEVPLGKKL